MFVSVQIKVEKERNAQHARMEASKLIWAKVEVALPNLSPTKFSWQKQPQKAEWQVTAFQVLHRALAIGRGSLVAGEITKVHPSWFGPRHLLPP